MRLNQLAICGYAIVFFVAGGVNSVLLGAEETNSVKGRTEELREQLKKMSPAERDAKLKEMREKYNQQRPKRELVEKHREELKNLSPAERQAKLREWRTSSGSNAPVRTLTTKEREAKRHELRDRLQLQMENVRTNTDLNLTPEDRKRFIQRMQEVANNFDHSLGGTSPQTDPQSTPAEK
jgi:hypothetical protein